MNAPAVSFIVPTGNRRIFLRRALRYIVRQTLSPFSFETIIVDGSDEPLDVRRDLDQVLEDYIAPVVIHVGPGTTVGERRNIAIGAARGRYVVHVDDDDWYAPTFAQTLLEVLEGTTADLVGIGQFWYYDAFRRRGWRTDAWENHTLAGSTFCYRRELLERIPFEHVQTGEDFHLIQECRRRQLKLVPLERPDLYVYIRHRRNVSLGQIEPFISDEMTAKARAVIGREDLTFYDELAELVETPATRKQLGEQWHLPPNLRKPR